MTNEILANPNPLLLASGVEGSFELGGQVFYPGIIQGCRPELFDVSTDLTWNPTGNQSLKKTAGANGVSSFATMIQRVPREQPFWMNGTYGLVKSVHQGAHHGFLDSLGRFWGYFAFSNAFDGSGWHYLMIERGVDVSGGVFTATPAGHNFAVQVSANTVTWMKQGAGGFWQTLRVTSYDAVGENINDWRAQYILYDVGTELLYTQIRVDEATVPMNAGNVTIEQVPAGWASLRNLDNTHIGVTSVPVGDKVLLLSHPLIPDPYTLNVSVAPLYLRPAGGGCGASIVEGSVVQFESNGGLGGVFTASGGTILSGLRWQAPYQTGPVDFSYTIGVVTANCQLYVVPKLEVEGVDEDGYYPDLAQGEAVQFKATCPGARYRSLTHPYIISTRGGMYAPDDVHDEHFGEKVVTIQVFGCGQTYTFKVRIQPMFPTPKFCGPDPLKWTQLEPDFKPNVLEMAGGTTQVKNRNSEGIITWVVEYNNLVEKIPQGCTCEGVLGTGHLPTCDSKLATASRLSEFYRKVSTAEYFSVVDLHTGVLYKYVRLTQFDRDHVQYRTEQVRRLRMRYEGLPLSAIIVPILTPDTDDDFVGGIEGDEYPDGGLTYDEFLLLYGEDGMTYL